VRWYKSWTPCPPRPKRRSYELDAQATGGQTRRFIQTDLDSWHWEEPLLTRDPRVGPFHAVVPLGEPLTAVAHFGPNGLEGRLSAGPFRDLADAVLTPPNGRSLAVHIDPDGAFRVGADDVRPPDQYLAGAVLSDRQQRRQEVYQKYLTPPKAGRPDGPAMLLAWASPLDLNFTPVPDARTVGDALLALPLHLERSPVGTHVTVPGPLLTCRRRVPPDGWTRPTMTFSYGADMELRFQLPAAVLPLQVERARLSAKISAPGRRVVISAPSDGGLVELQRVDSPLDPIRIDVTDERLLRLDANGCLHLNVSLSEAEVEAWKIDYLEIEVSGTVTAAK
jgi:hypothetical protein